MIPGDFSATLRYHAAGEPDTLLADIDGLRASSRSAQARRWWLIGLPLVWIAFGLVTAIYLGGGFLILLAVLWGIGGFVLYSYVDADLARGVLEVRRLKTARALVRALACDLDPGDRIELMIQFGPYHAEPFRLPGTAPGYPSIPVHAYHQPWLAASGRFADGTRFEVGVELHARRKERSKSKGRKKVKEDLCEHVSVRLRPAALPSGTDHWPARVRRAALPGSVHVHKAEVRDGRVALVLRTARHVRVTDKGTVVVGKDVETRLCGPHQVLKPLLAAYAALAAKGA